MKLTGAEECKFGCFVPQQFASIVWARALQSVRCLPVMFGQDLVVRAVEEFSIRCPFLSLYTFILIIPFSFRDWGFSELHNYLNYTIDQAGHGILSGKGG